MTHQWSLLAACLLALGVVAFAGCNDKDSPEFTTLAYNVAGLPQEVSQVNPEEHIPLISPLLIDYDIVLTQEDFDWWVPALDSLDFVNYHARLRAQVDHAYQSDKHPGPEAVGLDVETERPLLMTGDGLGMLSRFQFDEFRRMPWEMCAPAAADCLAMKGFGMARVELGEGAVVDVYTLHAEAGGEAADNEARAAGFEQLAAYIAEQSVDHAVILGGDTNLHTEPESDDAGNREDARVWAAFLEATRLVDVCDALDCADPTRIDKFAFRSAGGVDLEPLSWTFEAEKFVDEAGEPLSDHDPLAVRWRWSRASD